MNERILQAKVKELSKIASWAFDKPVSVAITITGRCYCDVFNHKPLSLGPDYFIWFNTPGIDCGVGHRVLTWKDVVCLTEWLKEVKREVAYNNK